MSVIEDSNLPSVAMEETIVSEVETESAAVANDGTLNSDESNEVPSAAHELEGNKDENDASTAVNVPSESVDIAPADTTEKTPEGEEVKTNPEVPSTGDVPGFQDVHERALKCKDEGTTFYKAQQFTSAKVKYGEAMAIIQNQSGDFSNEQRAIIFEMSLTCSSNLSLCSWSLNEFQECVVHGRNTLLLINALESKMSDSMIWEELQKKGMTSQKMSALKLKAHRIVGKSQLEKGDYVDAKNELEAALKLCDDQKLSKELNDLIQRCAKKISQQSKKEKSMWKKAFETNNKVADDATETVVPLSPSKSNVSNSRSKENTASSDFSNHSAQSPDDGTLSNSYDYTWPLLLTATAIGAAGLAFWWMRRRR